MVRVSRTDKCVLDSCRYMQQRGWDVTYLPVSKDGLIDLDQLKDAIREDTAIVSVMYVNNEIGEHNLSPQVAAVTPANTWSIKHMIDKETPGGAHELVQNADRL